VITILLFILQKDVKSNLQDISYSETCIKRTHLGYSLVSAYRGCPLNRGPLSTGFNVEAKPLNSYKEKSALEKGSVEGYPTQVRQSQIVQSVVQSTDTYRKSSN